MKFSYNLLHMVYISASLYMMMTLTNWYQPEKVQLKEILEANNSEPISKLTEGGVEEILHGSMAIFWVKSSTAFVCQFFFLIIVAGRLYHRNRNSFYYFINILLHKNSSKSAIKNSNFYSENKIRVQRSSCKWFLTARDLVDSNSSSN